MKVAVVDNYDSFVYNLNHLLRELGAETTVFRNDSFEPKELELYDKILLSPGPGVPSEAGCLLETIRYYAGRKPILGICLGEQAIGEVFGAQLLNLNEVFHGIRSSIEVIVDDEPLFGTLSKHVEVGRYHSWVVDAHTLPSCLEVTAVSAEGHIMALRHREMEVRGVQFHPESVLTPDGRTMINNWLQL